MKHTLRILLFGCILFLIFSALSEEPVAENITKACGFRTDEGKKPRRVLDNSYTTYWEAKTDDSWILIRFPKDMTPGGLWIEWYSDPASYVLEQLDAEGNVIGSISSAEGFPCISTYLAVRPDTAYARLTAAKGSRVCRIRAYSAGPLPERVQVWNPPVEKADIMLVSTHQDDEILWFGGAIPYYNTVRESRMIVVYMANCGRRRKAEALRGLWTMGVRTYPEFLDLKDKKVSSVSAGIRLWGGSDVLIGLMTDTIRRYRPEVILCQDIMGEYGHNQHKVTSRLVPYAVEAASDPSRYPDSFTHFGTWEVRKVYRHLGEENVIHMDWNTPSDKLGGLTPLESAGLGYAEHISQQDAYDMSWGVTYDNTKFSLVYTTVGGDHYGDDFLENTCCDPRGTGAFSGSVPVPASAAGETGSPEPRDHTDAPVLPGTVTGFADPERGQEDPAPSEAVPGAPEEPPFPVPSGASDPITERSDSDREPSDRNNEKPVLPVLILAAAAAACAAAVILGRRRKRKEH